MQRVEITADQAREHGLPPVSFSVDATGTYMSARAFPGEPDMYLNASGPPGGPLCMVVWSATERATHAGAIEYEVRRRHSNRWDQPLAIGEPGPLFLGGVEHTALSFTTKDGMWRTCWCAALVPSLDARMLVVFGRGSPRSLSCADIVTEPALAVLARTFAVAG